MTFQLNPAVARAIRDAVKSGEAPSANVFVEDAVRERLRARRQARVYSAYANAARDAAFLDEIQALDGSFEITLADHLP
jgi:Arc/MetJ-type ribon-helix-helix transcriptional regulator